jgi:hypothetical protein
MHISKKSNWKTKIFTAVVNYLNILMLHLAWLRHNTFPKYQRIFVLTLYNTWSRVSVVDITTGYSKMATGWTTEMSELESR